MTQQFSQLYYYNHKGIINTIPYQNLKISLHRNLRTLYFQRALNYSTTKKKLLHRARFNKTGKKSSFASAGVLATGGGKKSERAGGTQ